MRTLFEIIEAVKNNEAVTEDEMRYSICVMDALMIFDRESLMTLVEDEEKEQFKEFGQLVQFCYKNRIDLFCNPYNTQYVEIDFHKDLSEKILFEIKKMES